LSKSAKKWSDTAVAFGFLFCLLVDTFTCELLREWAEKKGLKAPPDNHAWGGVMRRLRKLCAAEPTNTYVKSRNPDHHNGPVRVWRSKFLGAK
jgi:hypothetical protein